ncbi:hypothetical protein BSM4216_1025 [Bacillus smithii]|nr:hypothetical protein BSM4216_1025 [Bacillus smithii]
MVKQIITFLPFIKQKAHAHYRPKHWIGSMTAPFQTYKKKVKPQVCDFTSLIKEWTIF